MSGTSVKRAYTDFISLSVSLGPREQAMVLRHELERGRLTPNGQTSVSTLGSSGQLRQISVLFDGSATTARDSYFELDYDGGPTIEYPSPADIKEAHGVDNSGGSLANVIEYNRASYLYAYYFVLYSEYTSDINVVLHNGDRSGHTNYKVWVLYNQH